jgi:hypothetical protein
MTMQALSRLRRVGLVVAGLTLATTLASCGGSSDDNGNPAPPPVAITNTPPASASASALGFIAYVKVVITTSSDTGVPVDLTGFVAPTDDTAPFDPSI